MDEDVEIVSDDEDGDAGHQKPKANDKKKVMLKGYRFYQKFQPIGLDGFDL
jgi:hypothetical protein